MSLVNTYFGNFNTGGIDLSAYCDVMEQIFNQDERGLKDFAFKLFDINNDKRISENDLFELMKMMSFANGSDSTDNKKVEFLNINEFQRKDLFLEIFSNDYIKILRAIERKMQLGSYPIQVQHNED